MNHQSEHFYRYLFEFSQNAILITSPDGRIHKANPAACKLFQKTEEEIILGGRAGLIDIHDPRIIKAIKDREKYGFISTELPYKKKDGSSFIGHVSSTIFHEENEAYTIMIIRDLTLEKKTQALLIKQKSYKEYLAHHDYLTKTWNRRGFINQFKKALKKLNDDHTFFLFLMDMDLFKDVNDNYGHLQGDYFLRLFSTRMRKMRYKDSIFARHGGDEFIYYVPNINEDQAKKIAQKIKKHTHALKLSSGDHVHMTISVGIAMITKKEGLTIDQMISKADRAMYEAKKERNTYHVIV